MIVYFCLKMQEVQFWHCMLFWEPMLNNRLIMSSKQRQAHEILAQEMIYFSL